MTAALALITLVPSTAAASAATSSTFASWAMAFAGAPDITFTADAAAPHTGAAALQIVNRTAKTPNVYAQINQTFAVQPGTTYHFTAWAKASNASTAAAVFIPMNSSWSVRTIVPGGTYDWRQLTWDYTIPAGQTSFTYRILSQDVGTTWLDDLTMTADGATTNLIQNAGFETNTAPPADLGIANTDMVFNEGDVTIRLTSTRSPISWTVGTPGGQSVRSGSADLVGGTGAVQLNDLPRGYYSLQLSTPGDAPTVRQTSFQVLDAAPQEPRLDAHPFGVATHIGQTNADQLTSIIGPLGVSNVRFDVSWSNVEQTKGQYTFQPVYDTQVAALVHLGVRPLIILDYRNQFYDNNKTPSSPEGIAAFAAYASAVASHYGSDADYEVYNEYNGPFNDGACGRTADCYLDLLKPTYAAIKTAAPSARVVGPALAEIDMTWLQRFFAIGGLQNLDVLSLHTYDWPSAPEGQTEAEIAPIVAAMRTYNNGQLIPIWWTEHGWPTPVGGNTEQQQSDYTVRSFVMLNAAGVQKSFVYDLIAQGNPTDTLSNYGIVRDVQSGLTTLAPKPAYASYAVLNRELAGKSFAGRDDIATGVYSYVYTGASGATTRVVWATTPTTISVPSSGGFQVTDTFGRTYQADGSSTPVQLALSGSPIYLEGSAVGRISATTSPNYRFTIPGRVALDSPVDATASVTNASTTDVVRFADETAATTDVQPDSGSGSATLVMPAFHRLGQTSATVAATTAGRLVALFKTTTEVVESPSVALVPRIVDGTPHAYLRVDNSVGQRPVHVSSLTWKLADATGTLQPGTDVAPGAQSDIELPIGTVDLWTPLAYSAAVTFGDGTTRSASGKTSFAPLYQRNEHVTQGIDLTKTGTFVSLGGQLGGPSDLGGGAHLSYDSTGLNLKVAVTDDVHVPGDSAANLWRGDSVQFAVSPGLPGTSTSRVEIGAALLSTGPTLYAFTAPAGPVASGSVDIVRDETAKTTSYNITVPWSVLGVAPDQDYFSFSMLVNDNDTGSRDGYLEWGSGIGATKDTRAFLPVTVMHLNDTATTVPGKGVLHSDNGWDTGLADGDYNVVFNLWWGENGSRYRLYENGVALAERDVAFASPSAQQVSIPIAGRKNGDYVYTAELVNSKGVTAPDPITVRVRDANPAVPVLSTDQANGSGTYTIDANLWWGTNATTYRVLEDGTVIGSGSLTAATPGSQKAQMAVTAREPGKYTYTVEFENSAGVTSSAPLDVTVTN